jgi:Leucine-rich repeat (LRR) protein
MAFSDNDIISNAGANTPPAAAPQDQQQPAVPSSPSQDASAQSQPTSQSAPPQNGLPSQAQQKPKDPNQQMISGVAAPAQPDHSNDPLVQHASRTFSVAQTLAGGPQYRTTIDSDGNRTRTPVPTSGRQIAWAIALEAISGGLSGLAAGRGKGPGAAGLAGFQQVQKQIQQRDEHEDQQAQNDFVNKASAYSANLRTRALAQEVGARDEKSHKDWVSAHASTASYLRENFPEAVIKDMASEAEVTTPEFTKEALKNGWVAIPVGYTPRYDNQGNHFSKDGTALHDNLYMIADSRKLEVPTDVVSKAQSWSLPGVTTRTGEPIPGLDNMELRIGTILDMSNKVSVLDQEQKDLTGYYGYLADKGVKGQDGKPITAPDLKSLVKQNPTLIGSITGPWANTFGGESPSASFKAMKDSVPGKGALLNLYGGQQTLDKYDLLKDTEKKTAEKSAEAAVEVKKERDLIPIKVATVGGEAKARAAAAATSAKNEDGSWNMNSIPVSLVEGTMDPSQLSKRSADYDQKIEQANSYSMARYGRPFDLAQAQGDFKFANNPSTQNTLRYLNSLTGADNKGGNLGALVNLSNKINRTDFPALNNGAAWAKIQTGNPQMVAYYTAVTETADQVAKILQGGGSGGGTSDAKLKQAAELFDKGFSKDQIVAVSDTLRSLLANRKTEMIGSNRYLTKQFGGQVQAPTANNVQPPKGATMKVPGSDGKLHWSDGKVDLGVAQ